MQIFDASKEKNKILVWDAPVRVFHWLQWQSPATLGVTGKGLTSKDAKYRSHTNDDD